MKSFTKPALKLAETVAAAMIATMFLTFLLQIGVRYSARLEWIADWFPLLEPANFGWTLELCLALWVWLIFWGNSFVVRDQDHVKFDVFYTQVPPGVRKWFVVLSGVSICVGLLLSLEPTLGKFHVLRLKKTATLSAVFGDWIRMRDVYFIYVVFLVAVSARYGWRVFKAVRYGVEERIEE
ncbi:MAG: TRAP transporter small permease subunit [Hyphomicrobiales bacterium]